MTDTNDQVIAANYMAALATLLGGRPGRHGLFAERVELMLCGSPPDVLALMRCGDAVLRTGRPVIWVHHPADQPHVPDIGLVAAVDGQSRVFENCMLWVGTDGGRARLVPDSFGRGAYRFDDQLRLRHIAKAPAKSFEAAEPGMIRAYTRLRRLEAEQRASGEPVRLPELRRAA